ncbi:Cerato-platanin [Penicillium alfredii]|uniref:Cerato-platanin n=1 Tax=Penicillium alfredii TaxID=1506179 RepID=A0A9W9EHJ0_9EURO|nr:Cerato-platanin [Penicillium alfredii]KAJ5081847.1 Cerato-platanin [Penicillium alfredii]
MKATTALTCAFLAGLQLVGAVPAPAANAAQQVSVSYDTNYDIKGASIDTVACADGENGLKGRGYSTLGSLPKFPLIGGALTIPGTNSPNCGKCYQLHYASGTVDKTINVLAVDTAPGGFNIGLEAMNQLTDGSAEQLGRVDATYVEVEESLCGM